MARTVITVQRLNALAGAAITFVNADVVNGMQFANDGKTVIIVNTPAGGGIGVKLTSQVCSHNRLGDQFVSVAASTVGQQIGPFVDSSIWGDAKGTITLDFLNNTGTNNQVAAVSIG